MAQSVAYCAIKVVDPRQEPLFLCLPRTKIPGRRGFVVALVVDAGVRTCPSAACLGYRLLVKFISMSGRAQFDQDLLSVSVGG